MGDFGRELSCKRADLENKGENCDGTDFKTGVAATLPDLSEWNLLWHQSFLSVGSIVFANEKKGSCCIESFSYSPSITDEI